MCLSHSLVYHVMIGELHVPLWFCVESIEHVLDILFNTTQLLQVYLGEQFVNNPTLSDVTFLIEGKPFILPKLFAHANGRLSVFWAPVFVFWALFLIVLAFHYQVNGSTLTGFVCLLLLMHFAQCLMVVTGYCFFVLHSVWFYQMGNASVVSALNLCFISIY